MLTNGSTTMERRGRDGAPTLARSPCVLELARISHTTGGREVAVLAACDEQEGSWRRGRWAGGGRAEGGPPRGRGGGAPPQTGGEGKGKHEQHGGGGGEEPPSPP